jgi:hypothetical protein
LIARMYHWPYRLLREEEPVSGRAALLEGLANAARGEKAQAWGKHGHGCLRGPVPGDVRRARGGGMGAARAQQSCG